MFDHIVVPLDGSELSEAALAFVIPLAVRLNSKVVLLHVDGDPFIDMFGEVTTAPTYRSQASMWSYLTAVSERVQSEGVECEIQRESGAAAAVILEYIEEQKPDLIAMSTHGRSGPRRMVVGSVTTTILPRAGIPVLAIHPGPEGVVPDGSIDNLIIPLDMSERSEDVLASAALLAQEMDLDATLITCMPSPAQTYIGSVPEMYPYPDDLVQQAQSAAEEYLANVGGAFNDTHNLKARWELLEGGPASSIVEYAASQPNSLIAMCTQGRTGLGRWVLGSVTDAVIRTGGTPVLVIPHPEQAH